jgi:uncharacterized DUF497 family protein
MERGVVEFEWDEAKRQANIAKHGIDFRDAEALFDGRPVVTRTTVRDGEVRAVTVGTLDGIHYAVVSTERSEQVRIISVRRARRNERRDYREVHGGGTEGDGPAR